MLLGAGRETKDGDIDMAVGIQIVKKIADKVKKGDVLAVLHVNDECNLETALEKVKSSYSIAEKEVEKNPLIYEIIE